MIYNYKQIHFKNSLSGKLRWIENLDNIKSPSNIDLSIDSTMYIMRIILHKARYGTYISCENRSNGTSFKKD